MRSAKLDGEGTWITGDNQYDALGRVWRVSNPYHASGLNGAINPPNIWTTNQYDALSRTIKVTAQDGSESITTYYGNTVTGQDPAQKKRKSVSDALGRMIQVIEDPVQPPFVGSGASLGYFVKLAEFAAYQEFGNFDLE